MGWIDNIEKAQEGTTINNGWQIAADVAQQAIPGLRNYPINIGSIAGLADSDLRYRPESWSDRLGLIPNPYTQAASYMAMEMEKERENLHTYQDKKNRGKKLAPKSKPTNKKEIDSTYVKQDGGFLGTTNKGFTKNGAWGGPAQNGKKLDSPFPKVKSFTEDITNIKDNVNHVPVNSPYDVLDTAYVDFSDKKQDSLGNNNKIKLSNKLIPLKVGRSNLAKVDTGLIDSIDDAEKKHNLKRGTLAAQIKRETNFGSELGYEHRTDSNETYLSNFTNNYDGVKKYKGLSPEKFFADKRAPGVTVTKNINGWEAVVNDEKKFNNYLIKNPKLVKEYYDKLKNTPSIGDRNDLDIMAEGIKEAGSVDEYRRRYNPGDPNYVRMIKEDEIELSKEPKYNEYLQKRDKLRHSHKMADGGNIPGSVGFSYARTGAPSNGPYAKKTMPSAQHGLTGDIRKPGDFIRIPYDKAIDRPEEFIPTTKKVKDVQKRTPREAEASQEFINWYGDAATKAKFAKNTGMDPGRLQDFIQRGVDTPSRMFDINAGEDIDKKGRKMMGQFVPGFKSSTTGKMTKGELLYDTFFDPYADRAFSDNMTKSVIKHELGHASGVDSILGPALMRVLGDPHKQTTKNTSKDNKDYLSRAQESYGNFHQFRSELGLKPGQKVDKASLQKLIEEKKAHNNMFYQTYDDDKIVKAINTIASTNNNDSAIYAQNGNVIRDDNGYWNPDNWGKVVKIGSNNITMKGVNQPLLGVSNTGDAKLMKPGEGYKFKGSSVTEYPVAQNGLTQLDQLTNFTNYNKKQKGGWLDQL